MRRHITFDHPSEVHYIELFGLLNQADDTSRNILLKAFPINLLFYFYVRLSDLIFMAARFTYILHDN